MQDCIRRDKNRIEIEVESVILVSKPEHRFEKLENVSLGCGGSTSGGGPLPVQQLLVRVEKDNLEYAIPLDFFIDNKPIHSMMKSVLLHKILVMPHGVMIGS